MPRLSAWVGVVVSLVVTQCLWLGAGQQVVNLPSAGSECVNGELVASDDGQSFNCQCYPGWSGTNCSLCGGRVRLTNSSGIISEDLQNMSYSGNMNCLFFVEADQSVASIHVKLHLLHLECQWDYLTVFDGDSLFAPKLASYTGNLIEQLPVSNTTPGPDSFPFPQHMLSTSGPNLLLYFYSDAALQEAGFQLAYWVDYECPNLCSGRGSCDSSAGTCSCDPDWTGTSCQVAVCPNNCTGNGTCNESLGTCDCFQGFLGEDCSVGESLPHWSTSNLPSADVPLSLLARASHSAVVWEGHMLVYGGYQFPDQGSYYYYDDDTAGGRGSVAGSGFDVLRYSFESGSWAVVETSASTYSVALVEEGSGGVANGTVGSGGQGSVQVPRLPAPRYGHSAVIYDGSMYVFGGALYPSEAMVSELWLLNLTTSQWTPLFNDTMDNVTEPLPSLPVAVRGHTAHVVGSKMVVLFGISPGEEIFPAYVQEYDFASGEWSLVHLRGPTNATTIAGRMGHSSAYHRDTGLIYIHGGRGLNFKPQLASYDPVCRVWTSLAPSPSVRFLHSSFLLGPLLLSFAGCQGHGPSLDCFSRDLLLYNTLCDTWQGVELPGLPANASRYGHTSLLAPQGGSALVFGGFVGTLRSDMLRLELGNCSQWTEEGDCANASGLLCVWERKEMLCVSVGDLGQGASNLSFSTCDVAALPSRQPSSSSSSCPASPSSSSSSPCANLTSCQSCVLLGCHWGVSSNATQPACFSDAALEDATLNITEAEVCLESCFSRSSCLSCGRSTGCLWCPSLRRCVPSNLYGVSFNFGQCLGWAGTCQQISCQETTNCSTCQALPQCGWCNDPSDTGLGTCSLGGFGGPQNTSTCQGAGGEGVDEEEEEEWQFYQCSACQCNGHSGCVNSSACETCMNNTDGRNCESCSAGYFGIAANGGTCSECDCNGYNPVCDVVNGVCECLSFGVTGDGCTNCSGEYNSGDADNLCYSDLEVGFIFTFAVSFSYEVQGFYAVTPVHDESLHFRFQMAANPSDESVFLQLFLGRKTEDLWVLFNLTELLELPSLGTYDRHFDDFGISDNESEPLLTSFAHPAIRELENFSAIFDAAVGNNYTSHMWDGDVTLVLHLSNLNPQSTFRITVDQTSYLYLLYFFVTFISCFSVLLTGFLLVWYIKKKLALRSYMRQQYIELQRRVARPFTRVTLAFENAPVSTVPLPTEQNPSYLGVEACKDDKAAVLSLLVQLPGDHGTGYPSPGRTGLCMGSTLVYVNSSKKPRQRKRGKQRAGGRGEGPTVQRGPGNSFVVRTGRGRLRDSSDSSQPSPTPLPPVENVSQASPTPLPPVENVSEA